MGYYIEIGSPGSPKAEYLCEKYGAWIMNPSSAFKALLLGFGVVCVVTNPAFETAAFCYNTLEFESFFSMECPRQWVVFEDRELAAKLANYKGDCDD